MLALRGAHPKHGDKAADRQRNQQEDPSCFPVPGNLWGGGVLAHVSPPESTDPSGSPTARSTEAGGLSQHSDAGGQDWLEPGMETGSPLLSAASTCRSLLPALTCSVGHGRQCHTLPGDTVTSWEHWVWKTRVPSGRPSVHALPQVRVFTFSVGQHNYDVTPLQWMACANKGEQSWHPGDTRGCRVLGSPLSSSVCHYQQSTGCSPGGMGSRTARLDLQLPFSFFSKVTTSKSPPSVPSASTLRYSREPGRQSPAWGRVQAAPPHWGEPTGWQ